MKQFLIFICLISFVLSVSLLALGLQAQENEMNQLRSMYFSRDFEGGYVLGKELVKQFPQSIELRAWFILNMARNNMAKEAVAAADELIEINQSSEWGWFALAGALNFSQERKEEALPASEKALSLLPAHPDLIWIRAETLIRQRKESAAIDFIDKNLSKVRNPAELLATKGNLLTFRRDDPEKFEEGLQIFARVRQMDSTNVNAYYIPGTYLSYSGRFAEAYPLLKKALALAPFSNSIHDRFWQAILGLKDRKAEQKRQEIEADIEAFLQKRGNYPGALLSVTGIYRNLKLKEKLKAVEDKLLASFPDSREAEWMLIKRCRDFRAEFGQDGFKDREKKRQYQQMLKAFTQRTHFYNENLSGEAYLNLFFSIKDDSTVSEDEFFQVVRGMVKHERINPHITFAQSTIALAERKVHLQEAEQIARDGIIEAKKKIESQRRFYDTEADYENALNSMTALMRDALGWVFFNQDRLDSAETALLSAYNLNPKNQTNLYHLGRLSEATERLNKAEEFYIKGLAIQRPGENPCARALKNLFKKQHGSLSGFDDYLAKIEDKDRTRRKNEILAARIVDPEPAEPFKLKSLTGSRITLESLTGKIVVINFWGIWCGWCVKEMPDFQKLHEKYKDDPEVVILTINNDSNPDDVPPWMQKQGYDFTVLLDDGYVSNKAKIHSFPTTWFLDKQGRKAFIKKGWSDKLLEEFSWRIEALKKIEVQVKK